MRRMTLVLLFLLAAGCGTERIILRNPQTGQRVTCGPYYRTDVAGVMELRGCAEDYQRQGYQRVPE